MSPVPNPQLAPTRYQAPNPLIGNNIRVCPECAGRLRKVFNAVGVVFKGSGFYRTDSRTTTGAASSGGASTTSTASPAETSASSGSSATSTSTSSTSESAA